jgi:maltose alpha-D-glucosyltransferase / alpha-amylase
MQWSADRNGGFSTANPHRLYLPLITEQEYHYESTNVETQQANPSSLLSWMRQLIALRTRHRVLGRGDIEFLDPVNPHVLAFVRRLDGEVPMLCVANLSRLAQHVELDLRDFQGATPVEVFGYNRFAPIRDHDYQVTLAPFGFFWFSLVGSQTVTDEPPLPHLPGTMPEVLRRRAGLGRALEQWMPRRRWFAGKGRTVRSVHIDEAIPLTATSDTVLLIVTMSFTEGDDQRYAVPVMHVRSDEPAKTDALAPGTTIAILDDGGILIDAMADARGAGTVVGAALRRRRHAGRHGELRGHPRRSKIGHLADDPRNVNVLSVEQSNSSAIIDGQLIAKLLRRLEPGLNPDVELPLHLARVGFEHVPGVAATLDVDLHGEASPANVVVVHDAITHESDLWVKVLDDLSLAIDLGAPFDEHSGEATVGMAAVAQQLGRRTAELHASLAEADPAPERVGGSARGRRTESRMAPEAFTLLWQRSILQTLRNETRATQRELRRHRRAGELDPAGEEMADYVDRNVDTLLGRFDRLRHDKLDAHRIRIHGDLHLGQILWTGHDLVFIDFEGEPGVAISQRTIKRSPLSDVAGLMRSFDYAGRVAVHTAIERGRITEADRARVDHWRRGWTSGVQEIVFDTYCSHIADAGLLPADPDDRRFLLSIYTTSKSLYEVRYELAHRPEWVAWPMSAIVEMLEPARAT